MNVNFGNIDELPIPVYFIEGANDHHVSANILNDFSKNIKSSAVIIWFENSGHFTQWEEPTKFNQTIIELCLNEKRS